VRFTGRDTITIQKDSSADGTLTPDYSSSLVTGVPCAVTHVKGQETYRGRQLEALVDYVVETRYRSDITTLMRVSVTGGLYSGQTMNIVAVQPMQFSKGRPPMLMLLCRQVPA